MKITTEDGQEFELYPASDEIWEDVAYVLKPVKKAEKKAYWLLFREDLSDNPKRLITIDLTLTPTTANKFSEAISALKEYVTTEPKSQYVESEHNPEFIRKAEEARISYQESQ